MRDAGNRNLCPLLKNSKYIARKPFDPNKKIRDY